MSALIVYIVFCLLWGVFAGRMQNKLGYSHEGIRNPIVVGILNALICPVAMIIAMIIVKVD